MPSLPGNRFIQLVIQGTGDPALEQGFRRAAQAHPGMVNTHIGYSESRAHQLIGGADVIAVPSRFEPCGLTQLYGLRYGTVPVVRRVGGLADTVNNGATGFTFDHDSSQALVDCRHRAAFVRREQPQQWRALMRAGMTQDLSWMKPAQGYLDLYSEVLSASD